MQPSRTPPSWLSILRTVSFVCVGLSAFFFMRSQTANSAQLLFRIGIMVAGVVGLIVVTILELRYKNR
jgi:uncharacterized membrane protein